jgi:hypothetical protein
MGANVRPLVGALGEKRDQDHQIGQRKEPIVSLASGFRSTGDKAQMAGAGKLMNMVDADASQAGNFRIGEDLLAGFDRNHGLSPGLLLLTLKLLQSLERF